MMTVSRHSRKQMKNTEQSLEQSMSLHVLARLTRDGEHVDGHIGEVESLALSMFVVCVSRRFVLLSN